MLLCKGKCVYQQGIVSVIPISSLMKKKTIKLKIIVYSMVSFPLKLNLLCVCSSPYNVTKRHRSGCSLLKTPQAGQVGRKECLFYFRCWQLGGRWQTSVPRLTPPPRQAGVRGFTDRVEGRRLQAETAPPP